MEIEHVARLLLATQTSLHPEEFVFDPSTSRVVEIRPTQQSVQLIDGCRFVRWLDEHGARLFRYITFEQDPFGAGPHGDTSLRRQLSALAHGQEAVARLPLARG